MNKPIFDLQHQVQAALMDDLDLRGYYESVEVLDNNGIITLRGTVPSREARDRAEEIARRMDGVLNVINELDVV